MKVVNDDSINLLYNKTIPPIVLVRDFAKVAELLDLDMTDPKASIIEYCGYNSEDFFQLSPQIENSFVNSSTGVSALDEIRNLLSQYLIYNTTISVSCLPRYWYEPNNMIYIENQENGIAGNYVITQYSLPLTYSGVMSITMTEALTRV